MVAEQLFLTFRSLRIVENFTGFLLDNQEAGQSLHPQRGDAVEKDYNALTAGSRGSYRLRFKLLDLEQAVEGGYYARYDHTTPQIQRLRFGTQIPYLTDLDLSTDVVNLAGYLDVDLRPLPFLTLRGGLRQDFFEYNVEDFCNTSGNFKPGQPLDVDCPPYDRSGPRLPTRRVTATGQLLAPKATAIVAFTTVHPVFDDDGTLVPYTPLVVARSDTALYGPLPVSVQGHSLLGSVGLGIGYIGKRSLPFSQFSDPTLQIDASATVRWTWLKLGVAVTNLTNRQFPLSQFFYASDFHSRPYPTLAPAAHFTAAPPRFILFTVEVALDREGD